MARVFAAAAANSDLADILTTLHERASPRTVEKYANEFKYFYARLADFPSSGPRRRRPGRNIRLAIISPYLVFYEDNRAADTVTVIRIPHEKRNITRAALKQQAPR